MVETTEVKHYQINGKYRVQFERSAVKGVIGFKVEANGDDLLMVGQEADKLMKFAEEVTPAPIVEEKK